MVCPLEPSSHSPVAKHPDPPWFLVGTAKLVLMSLVTFGMYQVYWFYQHWMRHRASTGAAVQPLARAILGPLFCYPLFTRMASAAGAAGVVPPAAPEALAIAYVLLNVSSLLPEPYWLLTHLSVVPLVVVQRLATAAALRAAPDAPRNTQLTRLNRVAVILGGPLLLVTATGVLLPEFARSGSKASLARLADEANKGLPRAIDADTELIRVEARPGTLVYSRRLLREVNRDVNRPALQAKLRKQVTAEACADARLRRLLNADVTLLFSYRDRNFEDLLSLDVRQGDCTR